MADVPTDVLVAGRQNFVVDLEPAPPHDEQATHGHAGVHAVARGAGG